MRWNEIESIPCPVAQTMAVIGDSWTVLILRDALRGATRFEAFQRSTGASRAVLAERLSHLVEHGVMQKTPYAAHPPRHDYQLTEKGRALQPVLMSMAHWAETQVATSLRASRRRHTTCGHRFEPVVTCSECGEPAPTETISYDPVRKPSTAG